MPRQSETSVSGSLTDWVYGKPKSNLSDPNSMFWFNKPAWEQPATTTPQITTTPNQRSTNQSGDWSNTATPSRDTSQPILGAINRKLGGSTMPTDNRGNTPPPPRADLAGGPTLPPPVPSWDTPKWGTPEMDRSRARPLPSWGTPARPAAQWRPVEPIRGNILNPIQAPQIGTPIVDIAPAPTPQPTTPAQTKVGGPSGFTEQFTAPATAMPSVDQLYKIYTDMAGENQGMREFLASPQFQGLWQSGNIPYWMLSDPVWRSYLQKIGLLNWDALARRMGQQ